MLHESLVNYGKYPATNSKHFWALFAAWRKQARMNGF